MTINWLWDRKTSEAEAKKILADPVSKKFVSMAAVLLARHNNPKEIFKDYLDPLVFCKQWASIKKRMRQDKWNEPRIVFWQAIYEKMSDTYRKKGVSFREKPAKPAEPLCKEIGDRIKDLRREQGLSQKELAKKIRISQQLISRIETGRENVSLVTLANIAYAFNKKVEIHLR